MIIAIILVLAGDARCYAASFKDSADSRETRVPDASSTTGGSSTSSPPAAGVLPAWKITQVNPCMAVVDDRLVNIEPLQNSDGTARFNIVTDDGWSVSFNPCSSYNLPADAHSGAGDQCHHVAICRYRPGVTPSDAGKYYTLGIQRTARFNLSTFPATSFPAIRPPTVTTANHANATDFRHANISTGHVVDDVRSVSTTAASATYDVSRRRDVELPVLVYRGIRSMRRWKTSVYLECDHTKATADQATFSHISTNSTAFEHSFLLRHRCCCPDACPEFRDPPFLRNKDIDQSSLPTGMAFVSETESPASDGTQSKPPPRFLWLILVVNAGIFLVAVMVAALCCRRGGGGLMTTGPYTYIPAIHASRVTLTPGGVERSAVNGSVASGLWTGQTVKRSASMSADYRDYSTAATQHSKLPLLDNCVIDIHSIDIGQRLGGGLFGDTYTCEWKDRTVAAKRITVGVHQSQLTTADYEWIVSNITMLSKQRHQNLVAVLGVCIETRQPYVISEFIEGESLRDLLRRSLAEPFGWPHKIKMCIQTADGMAFLHSAKTPILHRDLRCANILVDKNGKIKIVDFGLTKIIQRLRSECDRGKSCYCQKDTSATPASIRWTAPEILSNPMADDVTSVDVFTPGCDVFSFAMVLWELATCTEPFEDIGEETQVAQLILDGTRPSLEFVPRGTLPHIKELMKACWDQTPQSRPSFKQIALYLKSIQQVLTKMNSSSQRNRSDSLISTTTSYLRSALNIANDS